MLSQVAVEALYSAAYVENYLDSVENLPDDIQKYMTKLREIDSKSTGYYREAADCFDAWRRTSESESHSFGKKRAMSRMQQCLIAAQELGDEKLQVSQQLNDLIELKTRQLDQDHKNLDYGKDDLAEVQQQQKENRAQSPVLPLPITTSTSAAQQQFSSVPANPPPSAVLTNNQSSNSTSNYTSSNGGSNNNGNSSVERTSKRARRTRTDTGAGSGIEIDVIETSSVKVEAVVVKATATVSAAVSVVQASSTSSAQKKNTGSGKKKKRKAGRQSNSNQSSAARDDTPPPEEAIDPDEPTYCLCDQISFGEMILCDNDLCPIEWFHFSCVALMTKPKGKWFCPNCREKNRPTVMKAKAQFLKELERYNRDKEEKTSNASNPLA